MDQESRTYIEMTVAAAQKIGLLASRYPDEETVRIAWTSDDEEALAVEFADQYGSGKRRSAVTGEKFVRNHVVRMDGWSNPEYRSDA